MESQVKGRAKDNAQSVVEKASEAMVEGYPSRWWKGLLLSPLLSGALL